MNEVFKNFTANKTQMNELANKGFITATDLADYFVKELNYPFRKAYNITSKIVNYCEKKNKTFTKLTIVELRKIEPKLSKDVTKIFDLKNSINSKKSFGGTSFDNIKKMIKYLCATIQIIQIFKVLNLEIKFCCLLKQSHLLQNQLLNSYFIVFLVILS